jgi:flagellar biosynthesis/type III secretory pathway M-ring protein FliF/YscJ
VKQGAKTIILIALLASLLAAIVLFQRTPQDLSAEGQTKQRIISLITPIVGKDAFRVEISPTQNGKQMVAITLDEAKPLSQSETDDLTTLVRAAVGYDAARGDIIRIIPVAFKASWVDLSSDQTILMLELSVLFLICGLALWFYKKPKPEVPQVLEAPPLVPTLSDHVLQNPDKAAALLRVWVTS